MNPHIKLDITQWVRNTRDDYIGLRSIICHSGTAHGGHYVAYVMCNKMWYFYNDVGTVFTRLGSFNDVLNHPHKPAQTAVLLFYWK